MLFWTLISLGLLAAAFFIIMNARQTIIVGNAIGLICLGFLVCHFWPSASAEASATALPAVSLGERWYNVACWAESNWGYLLLAGYFLVFLVAGIAAKQPFQYLGIAIVLLLAIAWMTFIIFGALLLYMQALAWMSRKMEE